MPSWLPFALATVVCWGLWGLLARVAADDLDAPANTTLQAAGIALVVALLALATRPALLEAPRAAAVAMAAGAALALGLLAFAAALGLGGRATIVVPLTALYPLVTVALAVLVLREPLEPVHGAGVVLAVTAAVLLTR